MWSLANNFNFVAITICVGTENNDIGDGNGEGCGLVVTKGRAKGLRASGKPLMVTKGQLGFQFRNLLLRHPIEVTVLE